MEVFIGFIALYGFNWAPRDWHLADGTVLSIQQYSALYALLGTTFGGNGVQTFGLPDLRGRLPMGQGQGPGLSPRVIGEKSGVEATTILTTQMPSHTHGVQISATTANADASTPTNGAVLGVSNDSSGTALVNIYAPAGGSVVNLSSGVSTPTGGSQPLPVLNPYLALNFSIALNGIFPSRP